MKVVTAGKAFIDIDAYAGCITYAELLNLCGINAVAATTAPLNESITSTVLSWGGSIKIGYQSTDTDEFILVDISDPTHIDTFVTENKITEVIDHHTGHEAYWHERIGSKARIEFIGAACTQIYELWVEAGKVDQMSVASARLLITGILDNTLNFKAQITTERDHAAYSHLLKIANLPDNWAEEYFQECQIAIEADLRTALQNDTKFFPNNNKLPNAIGQLVVWDARSLLVQNKDELTQCMSAFSSDWTLNIISIDEGASYFVSTSQEAKDKISQLLHVGFTENIAKANRLWLRKEIVKETLAKSQSLLQ